MHWCNAGLVMLLLTGSVYAAEAPQDIEQCYVKVTDEHSMNRCLKKELTAVQKEHKDVTERVAVMAKSWDKAAKNRLRWDKLIRANQAFDTFMRQECDFVRLTTKGNRTKEDNARLACQINLYRIRMGILENRYLAGEKQ